MIISKGNIDLRIFSFQEIFYRSKEFLESIFLHLVKVQKLDETKRILSGELLYVSFLPGKLQFPGESPLPRIQT